MCLLRALHLAGVDARFVRNVRGAVQLDGLRPRRRDRRLRQRDAVGTHVGDEAVLVEPLRHLHRVFRGEAQLPAGLLLQRGRPEGRVGLARVRLALDRLDGERRPLQPAGQLARGGLRQVQHVGVALELAGAGEVAPLRHPLAVDPGQRAGEVARPLVGLARVEQRLKVPVVGDRERYALPFALHHQPRRHRLHPAGGQLGLDLLPQDGADLVTVEAVEDAPGLLGVHQAEVEVARVGHGVADRLRGDLVEHHAVHGHLGLEHLAQVPGDGLALAVLVSGQIELVGVLEQLPQLVDLRPLVGVDDVQRFELVLDVHSETRPRRPLVLLGDVVGLLRQVADVTDARFDDVAAPEVPRDRLRLGGRLDDHQACSAGAAVLGWHAASYLAVRLQIPLPGVGTDLKGNPTRGNFLPPGYPLASGSTRKHAE